MRMSKKIQVWRKNGHSKVSADSTTCSGSAAKNGGRVAESSKNGSSNSNKVHSGGGGGDGGHHGRHNTSSSSTNSSRSGSSGDDSFEGGGSGIQNTEDQKEDPKYIGNFNEILQLRSNVYTKMNWWPKDLFVPDSLQHRKGTSQPHHQPHHHQPHHHHRHHHHHHHHQSSHSGTNGSSKKRTNGLSNSAPSSDRPPMVNGHSHLTNGHGDPNVSLLRSQSDQSFNVGDEIDVTNMPDVRDGLSD